MTDWHEILIEAAEYERLAQPIHPTLHVGPNLYEAALKIGYPPEDLTLVTPDGRYEDSLTAYVNSMTTPGQEADMVNAAGQITIMETFAPRSVPIPGPGEAPNDMRPRHVDRAAIKAARKVARVNRRKRGRK